MFAKEPSHKLYFRVLFSFDSTRLGSARAFNSNHYYAIYSRFCLPVACLCWFWFCHWFDLETLVYLSIFIRIKICLYFLQSSSSCVRHQVTISISVPHDSRDSVDDARGTWLAKIWSYPLGSEPAILWTFYQMSSDRYLTMPLEHATAVSFALVLTNSVRLPVISSTVYRFSVQVMQAGGIDFSPPSLAMFVPRTCEFNFFFARLRLPDKKQPDNEQSELRTCAVTTLSVPRRLGVVGAINSFS